MKVSVLRTLAYSLSVAFLLTLCMCGAVSAQADTSTITGVVADAQGAGVPGASITLTSTDKGFTKTVQSSGDGAYSFVNVPPGAYNIEVTHSGFKKYLQSDVRAVVSNTTQLNIVLQIGDVSEQVTVTSTSLDAIVNSTDATIGNNFQPQQIEQLPTESRNINNLLSLQPGVTRDGFVNGGRSDQANITLDGVDVNDQQAGTAFFSVLRPLAEATAEFRVTTTNANAEQGRSSGAQITLLTKTGTNSFHGVAFWLPRRTFGSANDFFNNSTIDSNGNPTPRPNLNRNVFGGAIGGPIMKDRLFFFYSYEGLRETLGVSQVATVPRATLGQGIIRISPTQSVSAAQFNALYPGVNGENPAALAFLAAAAARYPVNDNSVGDGLNTGGFRFNAPTSNHQNTNVLRLDWNISSHQQVFFRGQQQSDPSLGAPAFPDTPAPLTWNHNTGVAVGHTWTIGANKINTFRYGLTRQAFTNGGDANANQITFRFVFQPLNYSYGLSRVTPIQNFTDDFTWLKGNHSIQFGGNVRLISNKRVDDGASFGSASTNPFFYSGSGRSLLQPLVAPFGVSTNNADLQGAVAAVIGRFSDYTATYVYDLQGNVIPEGTPVKREFLTQEYDIYGQDSWKIRPHLTLNFGLRYSLSRPVYEKNGFQIRPDIPLSEYLARRIAGSAAGTPYNEILNFELAGPKNNAPGYYSMDKNNFQPRVSAAWSPNFKTGFWGKLFGKDNESVFRGGFAVTNDYFGQQLAVTFNALSTLGFVTSNSISANTYNVTTRPGPLFTGVNQAINTLPGVPPLANRFQTPADGQARIEQSLDSNLVSPINYSWNVTYGRKLPLGIYIEASYVGRMARHLLLQRDAMQLNDLTDPRSGTDWYTAAGKLYDAYYSGTDWSNVQTIPYFENLFPSMIGGLGPGTTATQTAAFINQNFAFGDWTFLQQLLDDADVFGFDQPNWQNFFFQPQYGAFNAWSTVGKSNYHGASLSIRQRLGSSVTFDFNYTFSKSLDDASGLQNAGSFSGSAFVLNSLRQQDSYARSGFDARHVINANALVALPFGRGKKVFGDVNNVVNQFIGGWQLGGVFRYNTGLPISGLIDLAGWATNWEIRSRVVRTAPIQTSITRNPANLFSDLEALRTSVRPARPGETGERNVFFGPSWAELDMNLGKSFTMPWGENHKLQVRWEVFNVLNQQFFSEGSLSAFSISPVDPFDPQDTPSQLTAGTGQFTGIRGIPRRMQFVLRYSF